MSRKSVLDVLRAASNEITGRLQVDVVSGGGSSGGVATTISVDNFPTTQTVVGQVTINGTVQVSGTFYPTTQAISGQVSVSNFPASQAVTGTFWQTTQPISGTVSVANFPSSQPVTGVFWQTTQPVSGTVSVGNFPATQPVSGTVTANAGTGVFNVLPATAAATSFMVVRLTDGLNYYTATGSGGGAATQQPTYTATCGPFTPAATATDMFRISGSATKTIKILRIQMTNTQTTAGTNTFFVVKRTAANTAGTAVTANPTKHDSTDANATAAVVHYTANPSAVGAGTNIAVTRVFCPAPATATSVVSDPFSWNFNDGIMKPIILRGASEGLSINFNSAAIPAGLSVAIAVTWTEE